MIFSEIGLKKNLQKAIADLGFDIPTPIQQESIPYLLKNETQYIFDVIFNDSFKEDRIKYLKIINLSK